MLFFPIQRNSPTITTKSNLDMQKSWWQVQLVWVSLIGRMPQESCGWSVSPFFPWDWSYHDVCKKNSAKPCATRSLKPLENGTESPLTPRIFPYSPYFLRLHTRLVNEWDRVIRLGMTISLWSFRLTFWNVTTSQIDHPWKICKICQPQDRFRGHPWEFNKIWLLPCPP